MMTSRERKKTSEAASIFSLLWMCKGRSKTAAGGGAE